MNLKMQHAVLVELRVISKLLHNPDIHVSLKHMRAVAEAEVDEEMDEKVTQPQSIITTDTDTR